MATKSYILTLDIGTTNIKAFLFDKKGEIFDSAKRRPEYILDEPGKVEQDPQEIWRFSKETIQEVIASNNLTSKDIESIAISTQRASFCMWDKDSGELLTNIITWQDKRAAAFAEKMTNSLLFKFVRGLTKFISFLSSNPKWITASMLEFNSDHASARTGYILKNNPELKEKVRDPSNNIAWGTIDTWILWNLTEGRIHATDYSNASSTGLLDPFSLGWNDLALKAFEIPTHILPEVRETRGNFGETSLIDGDPIPIRSVIADQQASLFGQGCFNFGDMKVTNGTGSFVDINTGNKPFASRRKLYPLVAWVVNGKAYYMLEGLSHNTGNIIDWIQNELELYDDPAETEKMALSVDSTNGVYFLPTFTSGISFPYWDPSARGNIFGISLDTKKEHIVRAVLEGIGFRIKDFVEGIKEDTGIRVNEIKTDGGVSQNRFLLQFMSDILGTTVKHSSQPETTALGAAFMAGLESGFWASKEEILNINTFEEVYYPKMSEEKRNEKYSSWKDIIARSLDYNNV
ncbi:MAG: FGGY family carbohydrate kinase [Promethearchaeia archaeon]